MMQNETLTVRFAPEDTALETSAKLAQIARDSFIPEKKKLHLRSIANVYCFVENLCEYGLLRPPCSEDRRNILTILSNCMSSKLFLDAVGSHANPLIVGALGLDQEADSDFGFDTWCQAATPYDDSAAVHRNIRCKMYEFYTKAGTLYALRMISQIGTRSRYKLLLDVAEQRD